MILFSWQLLYYILSHLKYCRSSTRSCCHHVSICKRVHGQDVWCDGGPGADSWCVDLCLDCSVDEASCSCVASYVSACLFHSPFLRSWHERLGNANGCVQSRRFTSTKVSLLKPFHLIFILTRYISHLSGLHSGPVTAGVVSYGPDWLSIVGCSPRATNHFLFCSSEAGSRIFSSLVIQVKGYYFLVDSTVLLVIVTLLTPSLLLGDPKWTLPVGWNRKWQ